MFYTVKANPSRVPKMKMKLSFIFCIQKNENSHLQGWFPLHIFHSSWGETLRPWSSLELQNLSTVDLRLTLSKTQNVT